MALLGLLPLLLLPVGILLQAADAADGPGSKWYEQASVQVATCEPLDQLNADSAQCKSQQVSPSSWRRNPASKLYTALSERKAAVIVSCSTMSDACGQCCTDWLRLAWQLKDAEKERKADWLGGGSTCINADSAGQIIHAGSQNESTTAAPESSCRAGAQKQAPVDLTCCWRYCRWHWPSKAPVSGRPTSFCHSLTASAVRAPK